MGDRPRIGRGLLDRGGGSIDHTARKSRIEASPTEVFDCKDLVHRKVAPGRIVLVEHVDRDALGRCAGRFREAFAPGLVGPVRSARNIDIGILGEFGTPLLVHVGGIDPVLANIEASPIVNVDLGANGNIETHPSGRYAPYDTYSTTAQMWGTHPTLVTPPAPVFSFSNTVPPGGTPVASVNIDFSGTSNVTWKYNPAISAFQRFYNGTTPDTLADGVQNTAANVVVEYVQISYGPWVENSEGALEVQAALYPNASGNAIIFRGGQAIHGTWHRAALGSPTQFVNAYGQPIPLQPGQTWVELVPNTITATVTP